MSQVQNADTLAGNQLNAFNWNNSQPFIYVGCKVRNPYSRDIPKTAWSSTVLSTISTCGDLSSGISAQIPNSENSNLHYLLKVLFNITLPQITLSNICSDYDATTGTAGSYDITFPIPNVAALAAIVGTAGGGIGPGIAGVSTAVPTITTAGTGLYGAPLVGYFGGALPPPVTPYLSVGDLIAFRFCYSKCARIFRVTYGTTVECGDQCLAKSLFAIYPDICITPIFPVPVDPIIGTGGVVLYPGIPTGTVTAPSASGLVLPLTDPLTGIPLRGAGFGSIGAITAALPGGGGVLIASAATTLCPPVAPGPSCCGPTQPPFSVNPGVPSCGPALFPAASGVPIFTDATGTTPLTPTPLATPSGPFASLPSGAYEFMLASGFFSPVATGPISGGSILPSANVGIVGLISAIAAVGAPNSFCACQPVSSTPAVVTGCSRGTGCPGSGCTTCYEGTPGCLNNVPYTPLGAVFPSVGCVVPVTLQYPRQRVYLSPQLLLEYIRSVTFTSGCYTETITPASNAAYVNYIVSDDGVRASLMESLGNVGAYLQPYYAAEGDQCQTFIPPQTFSIDVPFGFTKDNAFPLFLSKKYNTSLSVQFSGSLIDYLVFEREVIQPVFVPPNSIGFSPMLSGRGEGVPCIGSNGTPAPANPDGSPCLPVPGSGVNCAIAPPCLPLQCTPVGIPGTGLRTGIFVQVNNTPGASPYLISFQQDCADDDRQFIDNPSDLNRITQSSFDLYLSSVTPQQVAALTPKKQDEPFEYLTEKFVTVDEPKVVPAGAPVTFNLANLSGETKGLFLRATNLGSSGFGYAANGTTNFINPFAQCAQPIVAAISSSDGFIPAKSGSYYNKASASLVNAAVPFQDNIHLLPVAPKIRSHIPESTKNFSCLGSSITVLTNPGCNLPQNYVLSAPISVVCCGGIKRNHVIPILIRGLACCSGCSHLVITAQYLGAPHDPQKSIVITPDRKRSCGGWGKCGSCVPDNGCGDEIVTSACGTIIAPSVSTTGTYLLELVALQWTRTNFKTDGSIVCADDYGVCSPCPQCDNSRCPTTLAYNRALTQTSAQDQSLLSTQSNSALQAAQAVQSSAPRVSVAPPPSNAPQHSHPHPRQGGCATCR